jgi:hypothetical protein
VESRPIINWRQIYPTKCDADHSTADLLYVNVSSSQMGDNMIGQDQEAVFVARAQRRSGAKKTNLLGKLEINHPTKEDGRNES